MQSDGRIEAYAKKERLQIERERQALEKNLAGIKEMKKLPDVIFVIDTNKEEIAVKEANRLGIPVVAVVDTNCSPEGVNHIIPGNDDALRAVRLFASRIADAILEGRQLAEQKEAEEAAAAAEQAKAAGVTIEISPRQQRERGGQPQRGERGERRERGGRGRGDRGRGDRRPKKTAPGTAQPAISGVRPSSVEAVETVDAVIHPAAAAPGTEAPKVTAPEVAPPVAETPAPEAEKTPAQDASAA
jgi:small subunit ribosomal protein S2